MSVNRQETNALLQVFANAGFGPGQAFPDPTQRLPHHAYYSANSVMCEETGAALEYCHLKIGADSKLWLGSASKEIGRLTQGYATVKAGTNTMHIIHACGKPQGRKTTYLNIVANVRPQKGDPHRIRFTVSGDRSDYPGPTAIKTAEIQTANLLFNSTISTKGGRFMCIELKDFYLGTPMNRYEYMWIKMANIPQDIIDQYGMTAKAVNGKVLVEIRKGMYNLKQAGRIANYRLKLHLKSSGYVPCKYTPGLFTHISRKISFVLCVDDFGVKYTNKADAQHLLTCLEQLYKCTTYWEGKLFLGMTLNWNYAEQWMEKSMPS